MAELARCSAARCLRQMSSRRLPACKSTISTRPSPSSSTSLMQRHYGPTGYQSSRGAHSAPMPQRRLSHTQCSASQTSNLQQHFRQRRQQLPQARTLSTTAVQRHGHIDPPKPGEERRVTFIDKDNTQHTFEVSDGDNLLDIAQANDLEMEGACGGSCACSTCHVIVESEDMFNKLEEPSDDENDMLDLAFGLTETSRLGCQVTMSKDLDGLVVKLPSMTRNLQASDFASKS